MELFKTLGWYGRERIRCLEQPLCTWIEGCRNPTLPHFAAGTECLCKSSRWTLRWCLDLAFWDPSPPECPLGSLGYSYLNTIVLDHLQNQVSLLCIHFDKYPIYYSTRSHWLTNSPTIQTFRHFPVFYPHEEYI